MTRLQKMFIGLAKYKTVEELKKGTSETFVDDLFAHLAFDVNGNPSTCGHFPHCNACVLKCNTSNKSSYDLTKDYLNKEIGEKLVSIPYTPNKIEIMQNKSLDLLKTIFDGAHKENLNPLKTAMHLDIMCDLLEKIGLFEPNECHDKLLELTRK